MLSLARARARSSTRHYREHASDFIAASRPRLQHPNKVFWADDFNGSFVCAGQHRVGSIIDERTGNRTAVCSVVRSNYLVESIMSICISNGLDLWTLLLRVARRANGCSGLEIVGFQLQLMGKTKHLIWNLPNWIFIKII